tara:strand:+ start:230 stop:436 length:207 start_codon:yes stop_codon:yes gene_type:complete
MSYKIKLVKGADDMQKVSTPKQSKVRTTLTTELTVKDLDRMKARAGLRGNYTREQIINAYLKTMLNVY